MNFGHNKTNLRKHLNRERNMARQRFSAIRIGNTNTTLYNMIRDPNMERVREIYDTHRKQIIRPGKPGGKPIKLKREYEFANGIIGVQNVANSYLNGRPVNKSRWVGQYTPASVKQTSNSFEIKKPVPVIAYKNGKYVGHVWREGAPPSETGTNTAKFIGIQKTLDPSVQVSRFAPALLKQVEKELGELGYKRMQTFPRRVMANIMRNIGWPNMNIQTSLVTKTIGRNFNRAKMYNVNSLIPMKKNSLMNNTKFSRNSARKLLKSLEAIQVNYPRRNRIIEALKNKLSRPE